MVKSKKSGIKNNKVYWYKEAWWSLESLFALDICVPSKNTLAGRLNYATNKTKKSKWISVEQILTEPVLHAGQGAKPKTKCNMTFEEMMGLLPIRRTE